MLDKSAQELYHRFTDQYDFISQKHEFFIRFLKRVWRNSISLLDYGGGGIGEVYTLVRTKKLPVNNYCLVERQGVIDSVPLRIRTSTSIPTNERFDIIYARSSVQYTPNIWEKFLAVDPDYICLSLLSSGPLDKCITQDTVYGKTYFVYSTNTILRELDTKYSFIAIERYPDEREHVDFVKRHKIHLLNALLLHNRII
jgi:hypothetical protein